MHVKFAELAVFDQDRALAFYRQMIGGEAVTDKPYGEGGWRWLEIALPGAQTRLLFSRRADESPSDTPSLVLVEANVRGMIERLRAKGVEIITDAREAPWAPGTVFAEFRDSEGNRIVVSST
ncbi:VOC family protein [Reyranella sp.]|uniref:VOC family protein n=1 Tax=Reyranella sp. TaxID=1929291 RepID=UPI0011F5D308|nr:VOC family protein [Reyranella sp.]TAJ82948.1 MAG: glyoxalase [Reyranella sp.]